MTKEPIQKGKLKIIVDSNALFIPLQFRIDVFSELKQLLNRNFELVLLSSVKQELEALAKRKPQKIKRKARYALELAEKCELWVVKIASKTVDDTIVEASKKLKFPVLTNDKKLRKRLRDISVPVIYVRQKSHFEVDGRI